MKKQYKRIFSLLLVLAMIVGVLPTMAAAQESTPVPSESEAIYTYTEADNEILDNDVFSKIERVESDSARRAGGIGAMTEEDYIALIPQVIEAIVASDTYVPGTLQQNGYFLVWETTTGMPCCYDPRMEEELHNTTNEPTPEEIAEAEARAQALLDDFEETRGGSPMSMNIGLIQPYFDSTSNYADSSFVDYSPSYKAMWQNLYNKTGGNGIRYTMTNATIDNIAHTMEECGLVIFDSHGTTDYSGGNNDYTSRANCSYLCLTTNAGVTSADTAAKTGAYGTYYNVIKGSNYAYVSGYAIANHMTKDAPHSLLYMGICLGMATDGMYKGLRERGVETVWGYSQSVTFRGEKTYMESILGYVKDGDEFKDAVKKTKDATCWWDPVYSSYTEAGARNAKAAFPICVSTEDTYPGHGNVDAIQNVYSTWTLLGGSSIYTINATSNNTSYGTVSVNGTIITATPKTGYYTAGYTVTSGTATVTQDGNIFYVTPSSNCTVRINFAAKTPCTVTLKANGSTYSTISGYIGDALTLPETATSFTNYKFVGWAANTISETSSKPNFYAPGASYTPSASTTLHAVYSRLASSSGGTATSDYVRLTATPTTWEGNYIITYGNNSYGTYVMKGLPAGERYEDQASSGAASLSNTGMTLANDTISGASDTYVFEIESSYDNKYSIKNKSLNTYLGLDGFYLASIGEFDSSIGLWGLSLSNGTIAAKNSAGSTFPYLSFSYTYNSFTLSSSASSSVYFWKQGGNDTVTYYTTNPSASSHTHSPAAAVQENVVPATCTTAGSYDEVVYCSTCGAELSRT
ncbi:MAG: InlB B-repeat-containing protein, partial [Oscillospiraceae bacterium]|nr:InlB B-repeat-containing protein [Oscillospiraceae bacterium]